MSLLEDQLFIKESTLPGSGKGLFTKDFIRKGTRIIEYKGKITTWKDVDHQNGTNSYIYFVTKHHVIDGLPYEKELARYANDARGFTRVKGITNNCQYVEEGLEIFIEAKKDLPAGSEILVGYGKEYWDIMKLNAKIYAKLTRPNAVKTSDVLETSEILMG
ncbi:MAG: SET domain-containing protein-lysine N-methyltransferase [Ferruginibacter sp.]